jgi:hypothetical protein
MADRLPGQCERCVEVLDANGYKFFFCDSPGYPMLAIYSHLRHRDVEAETPVDHDRSRMLSDCACDYCGAAMVIAYRMGLVAKTDIDEESCHRYNLRAKLRTRA